MKPRILFKKFILQATLGLTTLSMLVGLAFAVPAPVYAAASQAPAAGNPALERAYQAEQARLKSQAANLDKANAEVARIQTLISQVQAKSLNVTDLQTALATFQSQLASAQAEHNTAASILSTHAGFGVDGSVTNVPAARQTVLDARQALTDAAAILSQAARDLRQAIKTWQATIRTLARDKGLEKAFTAEQAWLQRQETNLGKTTTAIDKVQALLNTWQARGVNVTFLQDLLNAFKSQVAGVLASHQAASGILSSHAGFDANGKVTILSQAALTVQSAREALRTVTTELTQAIRDLAAGLRLWRTQHTAPKATPAPSAGA